MAPQPKRRQSHHRTGRRRTQHRVTVAAHQKCVQCGEYVRPHFTCANCGHHWNHPQTQTTPNPTIAPTTTEKVTKSNKDAKKSSKSSIKSTPKPSTAKSQTTFKIAKPSTKTNQPPSKTRSSLPKNG